MKSIKVTLTMRLQKDDGDDLSYDELMQVGDDTKVAIQNRLFGEGFIQDDVLVDTYLVTVELTA